MDKRNYKGCLHMSLTLHSVSFIKPIEVLGYVVCEWHAGSACTSYLYIHSTQKKRTYTELPWLVYLYYIVVCMSFWHSRHDKPWWVYFYCSWMQPVCMRHWVTRTREPVFYVWWGCFTISYLFNPGFFTVDWTCRSLPINKQRCQPGTPQP